MSPQELIQSYLSLYSETRIAAMAVMPDADSETIRAATDNAIAFARQSYPNLPLIEPLTLYSTQPTNPAIEPTVNTAEMDALVHQLDTPPVQASTSAPTVVKKTLTPKTRLKAAKKPNEDANKIRLEAIRQLTGHTWVQIKELARQLDLPLKSAGYSDRQMQLLRNSMYVDWGLAQEVFNHGNHALNSYSKMFTDEPDINPTDDTMVWMAWSSKVIDKVNQKSPENSPEQLPIAS